MDAKTQEALQSAIADGWAVGHNNIWSQPGEEVYPGCGGLPCIRGLSTTVRIEPTPAAVGMEQDGWPVALYVYLYGGGPCQLAMRFKTWADFAQHCRDHGGVSPCGMSGANVWD